LKQFIWVYLLYNTVAESVSSGFLVVHASWHARQPISRLCGPGPAGEAKQLLPVVGMMLRFSPAEMKRCQEALARDRPETPVDAAAMASADGSASEYGMISSWTSWAWGGGTEEPPKL
jgi:hypothetical protein